MTELCEWNPERDEPAHLWTQNGTPSHEGCQNEATVCVGFNGKWHLCAECAALPRFKRYNRRTPIGSAR